MNPYQVTRDFESALCDYTGAKYAVAVNSCTAAILLACLWFYERDGMRRREITIPARTYPSVPMAIKQAHHKVFFRNFAWRGAYQLDPLPVWDSARRFTSGMYIPDQFQCVSFSSSKILGIEQGGAILHDTPEVDSWFRKMRFDGRTEGVATVDDTFDVIGHHCLMPPGISAQLLLKLFHLPKHNEDLPTIAYPDLSLHPAFK